jgi:hypothetical protein
MACFGHGMALAQKTENRAKKNILCLLTAFFETPQVNSALECSVKHSSSHLHVELLSKMSMYDSSEYKRHSVKSVMWGRE